MALLGGTVRHRLDADGGTPGSGAAHDSTAIAIGAVEGYGYHLHLPGSPVTARYWRCDLAASGVSFLDVGRAWAGERILPGRGYSFGIEDGWSDRSVPAINMRSGAEFWDRRPRQRVISFALDAMSVADRDTIRELQRVAGISEQVFFMKSTVSVDFRDCILGRLAQSNPIRHRAFPLHATAFQIRESI